MDNNNNLPVNNFENQIKNSKTFTISTKTKEIGSDKEKINPIPVKIIK